MGDDTPLAVLSEQVPPAVALLPAEFQPGHQPADRSVCAKQRVMSLKTRLGNLGNMLAQEEAQTERLRARIARCSPTASSRRCAPIWARRAVEIDCTFDVRDGGDEGALRDADPTASAPRPRTRCAAATTMLILSDERMSAERAAIPMILATGAVHSHLVRQRLAHLHLAQRALGANASTSHYFAVLIGVGATTVNAYLAQETHRRPPSPRALFGRRYARDGGRSATRRRSTQGLLKIMSKMGISVISSYRGAYNFEAVGLSRTLVAEYLPRHAGAHLRHRPRRHRAEDARACTPAPSTRRSSRCRSAASTATATAARRMPSRPA